MTAETDFPRRVVRIPVAKGRINADDAVNWPRATCRICGEKNAEPCRYTLCPLRQRAA